LQQVVALLLELAEPARGLPRGILRASIDLASEPPCLEASAMNSDRGSKPPDLRSVRSEAGHRKLARWTIGLVAAVIAIVLVVLFARFVSW